MVVIRTLPVENNFLVRMARVDALRTEGFDEPGGDVTAAPGQKRVQHSLVDQPHGTV